MALTPTYKLQKFWRYAAHCTNKYAKEKKKEKEKE